MSRRYGYFSVPSVAQQKKQAEKRLAQLRKKDPDIQPIQIEGRKIAKSWWGLSWCKNLERYADYENRISRGRSYAINGLILDLRISEGLVTAKVSGSRVYDITIQIDTLPQKNWNRIAEYCAKRIDSIAVLIEGGFPEEFAEVFMRQGDGLFPTPKEIHMGCTCPDWADMCKHIAAVLYGVGAKLDSDPMLFFTLRGIDPSALIKKSVDEKMKNLLANARKKSKRIINDCDVPRIFGV